MPSKDIRQWFSQFTANSPFLFAILDKKHQYRIVNDRYEQIAGLSNHELIGMNDQQVLGEHFYQQLKPYYARALAGEYIQSEISLNYHHIETSLSFSLAPLTHDGVIQHIVFHASDTSEKSLLSRSLGEKEHQFHTLTELLSDGVLLLENDKITSMNAAALSLLHINNPTQLYGKSITTLLLQANRHPFTQLPIQTSSTPCIARHDKAQAAALLTLQIQPLNESSQTQLVLLTPHTEQPLDHNIMKDVHRDSLTKQYNRFGFIKQLERFIQTKQPLVLLYVDIDNFKNINDSLGHNVGDNVIKEVSKRLEQLLPPNAILGHLGGDEFAIIIPCQQSNTHDTAQLTEQLSERIISTINSPFDLHHFSKKLACSIGAVRYPEGGNDAQVLLQNADTAMFQAKERGRNRLIQFDDKMSQDARMQLWLEIELLKALQQNGLEVWYQPKVNARDFTINGAEALVHWKHPIEGYISPGLFIPVAEKSGLIEQLGKVVMREVFTTVKAWHDQGILSGRVAINLSPEQFGNPKLIEFVESLLHETHLNPKTITFELTESVVMSDSQHTLQMLNAIKRLGFSLSIDDFGTGYSSLAYLARFPLDELKIDRSFIMEIDTLPKQITVIENIINLGKSLNMSIVAEGVETCEQATLLSNLHCHSIQGFYFYKPQPKQEVEMLLAQNRHHKN